MEGRCATCEKLWRLLVDPSDHGIIKLSTFSDEAPCSHHIPLTRLFPPEEHSKLSISSIKIGGEHVLGIGYLTKILWFFQLVNNPSVLNHPGKGHICDPDWVDTDIIRQWKQMCLETHGETCNNPMGIWAARPAWLIDVEHKCLVSGHKSDGRFIALSYTYGVGTGYSFKIDNNAALSRLQKSNSLSMPEIWSSISPMIKHAISLTAILGERFLWADALCIPHFDKESTAKELNLMSAIYANAVITIIVMSTNSNEGIRGLKGVSSSRKLQQHVIPFGTEQIVARWINSMSVSTFDRPYNHRGWTYQEYMMSPRKLIFDDEGLSWECHCSYKKEWPNASGEWHRSTEDRIDPAFTRFPNPEYIYRILRRFNHRELTYDVDALPSITGLLSVFSRPFKGGFLYGLPECLFDSALGWRIGNEPYMAPRSLRRRRPFLDTSGQDRVDLGPSGLPSWSWIGWQGVISTEHCDNAYHSDPGAIGKETFPITQWFTAKSPTVAVSERRLILSNWYKDREVYRDPSTPLPPGWTRHEHSGSKDIQILYPGLRNPFVYEHEAAEAFRYSLGDEGGDSWNYPVPVADVHVSTVPFMPEQTEYLFCTTYKASLWTANTVHREWGDYTAHLLNPEKRNVGFLEPTSGMEDLLPIIEKQVELVSISRIKRYGIDSEAHPRGIAEHVAVLWVKWDNGIAYRRGYGEVLKEEWDELPLERIELVLG